MGKHNLSRSMPLLATAALLLLGACGDETKKESGTADEFLKKEQAALKQKQAQRDGAKAAEAQPAGTAVAEAPAAADPTPAPEQPESAAPTGPAAAPPTDLVRSALLLVRRGKYEDAIRSAKAALQRDEKYVPAMVVMARAYYHLNKLEFAESICDIALSIRAGTGECYNLKGFIALKNDDAPLARTNFEKATQVQPDLGPPWLNLGASFLETKSYGSAIPALENAVRLMGNRPEAHLNLGSAYRGEDQVVKAYNSYRKALELRPSYPAAYFNLGVLFLDAQAYPGMDKLQQFNQAVANFNKYKQQMSYLSKDDPVDGYIKEAQKRHEREVKDREREAKRKAREAARAQPKPAPAPEGKPAEGKPADGAAAPAKEGDGE